MSFSIKVTFNDVVNAANPGKIAFDIEKAATLSAFNRALYIKITDPLGNIIKALPGAGSPDFTLSGLAASSQSENIADIPLQSNGSSIEGKYIFEVQIVNSDAASEKEILTFTHDYCPSTITADLNYTVDCNDLRVAVNDNTDYRDYTITSRVLKVVPPTIPGVDLPTQQTDTANLVVYLQYDNVTYSASLLTIVEKTITINTNSSVYENRTSPSDVTGITALEKLEAMEAAQIAIACESGLCDVALAAQGYIQDLQEEACALGGISNLPKYKRDKLTNLIANLTLYNSLQGCNPGASLTTIVNEINKLIPGNIDISSAPKPFSSTMNLLVQQTPWQELTDATKLNQSNVAFYNDNTKDYPFRYRLLGTNHLEIQGTFDILYSGSLPFEVIPDFFEGKFAPQDPYQKNYGGSYIPVVAWNPSAAGTNFHMVASLSDANNDGKYSLIFHGSKPSTPFRVRVHGKFAL